MAFKDEYNFGLIENEAKRLVIMELEKQLKNEPKSTCRCEECVLDITTGALNSVKPLYRVSLMGALYASQAMNDANYAASVQAAVASTLNKVKTNPAHD